MQGEANGTRRVPGWLRRAVSWIPFVTLFVVGIAYFARDQLSPPIEELVIEPAPAASIPPLELPERTRSLSGRVLDPDDEGVEAALVWLRAGDEPHWTYTATDGGFDLGELEAGPWNVTVVAVGFAPHALTVAENEGPLTIRLEKPFGPAPTIPPIVRAPLQGRVTSRLAGTLDGGEVVLIPTLPVQNLSAPLPRRTEVAADGSFEIQDLIAGEYRVEVRPEWAGGGSWPDLARPLADGGGAPNAEARIFRHEAPGTYGMTGRLDIELATGEIAGKLVDFEFQTVEGALLLLAQASDASRVWPSVESGPDGSFSLQQIPAGRYTLTARAGSATLVQDVTVRAGETTTLGVTPLEVRRSR
ncbi:MAG: carboxypeptidase-like regulatory domain-containing protein [Planctomycetota bacterium]